MAQPPNYGGPPSGPDPQRPYGPGPGQPPEGQGPPQYPPPGQGPGQPPPGGVPPPYPPAGSGPGYPGGQGPGGGPYQYGRPPRKRRRGLIAGLAVAGAVVLIAAIVLLVMYLRDDDDSEPGTIEESTSEEATESPTGEEETTGPPSTEDAVGLCLPSEPQISGYSFDLSTPCDGDEAFWEITAASDDVEASVDDEGALTDVQPVYDVCGEEYGGFQLGEPWKDWYFTYDEASSEVEELYCVEAVGNTDAEGREPVTPDAGACFDDSDTWWTVPCDSDLALYEVVDTVTVDPPEEMSNEEANEASAPCSGGEFFWQVMNVEGLTSAILCGDER